MKAIVLRGPGELYLEEKEIPVPKAGEIILRTKAAAICGSDLRMLKNGYHGVESIDGCVMGHEISGTIEQIGEGVKSLLIGDCVTVAPNMGCGICTSCQSGLYHLCKNYAALGIHMDGGFAQYVRVPKRAVEQGNVLKLPHSMSFAQAALCEPFSCVYNGLAKCEIKQNETVLIFGAGAIGAMHAMLALVWGASRVFVYDPSKKRAQQCANLSEKITSFSGSMDELRNWVWQQTSECGVDVCVTACPAPNAQQLSLHLLKHYGRVCFFGGLPKSCEEVTLNTNLIHYKELSIVGSTRASTAQFLQTLNLIAEGTVCVDSFITGQYKIEDFKKAFSDAQAGVGIKTIITFDAC